MEIRLRYFAALRETIGHEQERLVLPDGADITAVRAALVARYPAISSILPRCVAACNRDFVADDTRLHADDELVFIPPMAGGCH